ncbi:uncharacterized protein E0L32_000425 [Thyridium curvatum]|uniref:Chorismate mutase domain-containing protein n=1 Tax=Thyridium curvatum TaxID=1093900 RepID=A0A507BAD6_9PEZI|nr:uncharacterized protein E0L32_000425 [Thyridium curvatum]TPX14031.1 hypothetical protein E0L32_000425 [Thyridium curvatum]
MRAISISTLAVLLASTAAAAPPCTTPSSGCHFVPSSNATASNFPGASPKPGGNLYDLNKLSEVPVASVCNSGNTTEELACARRYIDAIDEQLAYLYARRLGYAAVAGSAKFSGGAPLNDPSRNSVVAEGMAQRVLKYGGSADVGRVMGGEGCMIYGSLIYEVEKIKADCDPAFDETITRSCT